MVGELVIHNENGYVIDLHEQVWADSAAKLLNNKIIYDQFSQNSLTLVAKYNFISAANGIKMAVHAALNSKKKLPTSLIAAPSVVKLRE